MVTDVIKVALQTNCIKIFKFRIIKVRTGCQYIGYIYYSENLNWAACGPRIADLDQALVFCKNRTIGCRWSTA